jgi:multidrug efflux system membrane fusion protein
MLSKRHVLVVIAVLAIAGTAATLRVNASVSPPKAPGARPAAQADVATVVDRRIIDWHGYSGRLEAVQKVEIRPQVSGPITAVHFKDGAMVHKGDVLFTIDPRPYAAAVSKAEAQLAGAKARAAYTARDKKRGQRLLADNAIARRDFEQKRNAAREASAGQQAAEAALEAARLDLEHTRIIAPISGRMSRANVTAGNVVSPASATPLASLVSVSHMYASFDLDEKSFLKVSQLLREPHAGPLTVQLGLANETGYPHTGHLVSIDNQLDATTGTIRARALFDNPGGMLVPGLYAHIRVEQGRPHAAILIDQTAVGTDQDKRFVLVADAANTIHYRQVQLGGLYEGLQVVTGGLKPGERIVVNGLQRVRPGMTIAPTTVAMDRTPRVASATASTSGQTS